MLTVSGSNAALPLQRKDGEVADVNGDCTVLQSYSWTSAPDKPTQQWLETVLTKAPGYKVMLMSENAAVTPLLVCLAAAGCTIRLPSYHRFICQ